MRINELRAYDRAHPKRGGTGERAKLFLYGLIRMLKPHRVIEIGVGGGHSAVWLAKALEDNGRGFLWAVDAWPGRPRGCPWPEYYEAALARLGDAGLDHRVTVVRSDSVKFLSAQATGSAEVVWIDGGHCYDQVKADIGQALRVASRLIVVHDATKLADVNRACRNFGGGTWIYGMPPEEDGGFWIRDIGPAPEIEQDR